jgi:hypothetical protein
VCIRYRGNVSTEPFPSDDRGIFTGPLPSNGRGIFTEPLPHNDRGDTQTQTHTHTQQRDLILTQFLQNKDNRLKIYFIIIRSCELLNKLAVLLIILKYFYVGLSHQSVKRLDRLIPKREITKYTSYFICNDKAPSKLSYEAFQLINSYPEHCLTLCTLKQYKY